MLSLFSNLNKRYFGGGGSSYKPPPTPAPTPMPTEISPAVLRKSEDLRRKMLARSGRAGTILTGKGALGGEEPILGGGMLA